ncbi:MAG: hypothetical protein AAFO07_29100, partial [Bacteroidota bacterium]
MELKNLLDSQGWEQDHMSFDAVAINQVIQKRINKSYKEILQDYYFSILLNVGFIILTVLLYVFQPSYEMLFAFCIAVIPFIALIVFASKQIIDF